MAHQRLGIAQYMEADYEEAVKSLQNSLQINDRNAITHHNIGLAYTAIQLYGFAVRHFLLAIECDKHHFESYISLGNVYIERNEYHLAGTTFKSILRIDKTHEGAMRALEHLDTLLI